MMTYIALSLYLTTYLFFSLIYLINIRTFKNVAGESFSFLRHFPFELDEDKRNDRHFFLRAAIILIIPLMCASYVLILKDVYPLTSLAYIMTISGALSYVLLFFLFIIDTKYVNVHLTLFLLFALTCVINAISAIWLAFLFIDSTLYISILFNDVIGYIIAIFGFIILAVEVVILVNPKIKNWAKLEKHVNEDGTIIYKRPKIFILALSEWLLIALNHLSFILPLILFLCL